MISHVSKPQVMVKPKKPLINVPLTRQELNQEAMVAKFLKELELREEQKEPKSQGESMTATCVKYTDPRDRYMLKQAPSMTNEEKEKTLGPGRQATRYPVFKDVEKLWSFNYQAEEKKRFKALPMWVPSPDLSDDQLDFYLKRVYGIWPRNTGMNEEIALRLLMHNGYQVETTLKQLQQSQHIGPSYFEIVQLINQMTSSDAKIEMISFLIKMAE